MNTMNAEAYIEENGKNKLIFKLKDLVLLKRKDLTEEVEQINQVKELLNDEKKIFSAETYIKYKKEYTFFGKIYDLDKNIKDLDYFENNFLRIKEMIVKDRSGQKFGTLHKCYLYNVLELEDGMKVSGFIDDIGDMKTLFY